MVHQVLFYNYSHTRYPNKGERIATLSGATEIMRPTIEEDAPLSSAYSKLILS